MTISRPAVVVTGSSTGIGAATARALVRQGFHVFGSVRKQADAESLVGELGSQFTPLLFDVTDEKAVTEAADLVERELDGVPLAGLVNNAGIALGGPLIYLPIEEFRLQLEVNLTGVLIVTKAFAPLLGAREGFDGKPGRIINMGSVGGTSAYPFMAPYHTSKFGLEGFSESLRRELMLFGVDVILIAPASIATPIWEKAEKTDTSGYEQTPYRDVFPRFMHFMGKLGEAGIPAERVGDAVHTALTHHRPKTRYVVTGRPFEQFMMEHLPKRLLDGIIAGRLGLKPTKK